MHPRIPFLHVPWVCGGRVGHRLTLAWFVEGRSSIQLPLAPLSRAETGLVAVAVHGLVPIRCRRHPHGSFQLIHNPHCRQCRVQMGEEGGGDAQARVLGLLHHPVVTPTTCPPPTPPPQGTDVPGASAPRAGRQEEPIYTCWQCQVTR